MKVTQITLAVALVVVSVAGLAFAEDHLDGVRLQRLETPVGLAQPDRLVAPSLIAQPNNLGNAYAYSRMFGMGVEMLQGGGLQVASVDVNSLADATGLEQGDVIYKANNLRIDTIGDLEFVANHVDKEMELTVRNVRTGRVGRATMVLAAVGNPLAYLPSLDIGVEGLPNGTFRVSGVEANSLGHKIGLRNGDVMLTLNGRNIRTLDDLDGIANRTFTMTFKQAATGMIVTTTRKVFGFGG
ncbi:MAG: PDZ domain-containing protein [Planctomycetales bacterium]|nr:PDZ domain-containing protein [Planctomycetales bacterium]